MTLTPTSESKLSHMVSLTQSKMTRLSLLMVKYWNVYFYLIILNFFSAWMSHFNKDVSVILVDWHNLASAFYFAFYFDFDNYVYDYAARNAIDVGEFLGLCLAELKKRCVYI